MPFKSKSQIGTCYSRQSKGKNAWNCDEFLRNTPSVCCLPQRIGLPSKTKTRCMRNGDRIIGKVQTGPRGGKYFTIEERDKKGTICVVKVYLSKKK
jgi:hypothetical protein